jgi:malate dehydrogenase
MVKGRPINELLTPEEVELLVQRTRDGGAEIVSLLKTGSAYYAPSSAACDMLEAVLKDRSEVMPASVYLEGKYGLNGIYCGVPARIGGGGIEEVIELQLSAGELNALNRSAAQVREGVEYLKKSRVI